MHRPNRLIVLLVVLVSIASILAVAYVSALNQAPTDSSASASPILYAVSGDWFGEGVTNVGYYNPTTAQFTLRTDNSKTPRNPIVFNMGPLANNFIPIAGDWDGDGKFSVGLYNPSLSTFSLINANQNNAPITQFTYGISGWSPIAGDWNGDKKWTIGIYDKKGVFYLRNTNTTGVGDITLTFGNPGWTPLAGDWDGDGKTTIGAYDSTNGKVYLRNTNTTGFSNTDITYKFPKVNFSMLAGDWDGDKKYTPSIFSWETASFYLSNDFNGSTPFAKNISTLSTAIPNPNLKYWGYFQVTGIPAGTTDYVPEITALGSSNIITLPYKGKAETIAYLKSAAAAKQSVLLDMSISFFNGSPLKLIDTWQNVVADIKEAVNSNPGIVYGFYFDEPMWNNVPEEGFRTLTKKIRQEFPTKALLVIEGSPIIDKHQLKASYFEFATDFGFDFYPIWQNGTFDQYKKYYDESLQVITGKKIWIVPEGFLQNPTPANFDKLNAEFDKFYALATTDNRVYGVLNFLYSPGEPNLGHSLREFFDSANPYYNRALLVKHMTYGAKVLTKR